MSDVIDITSDSDDDLYARPSSRLSSQHSFSSVFVDLCDDSDDNASLLPPTSSQTPIYDTLDLCSSDDELPAPSDPRFLKGVQGKRKRAGNISRPGSSTSMYDVDSTDEEEVSPRKIARKSDSGRSSPYRSSSPAYGGHSSEEEEESPSRVAPKKAPRKPRKTEEEKEAAKALKQREAAQKKMEKADLKAAKDRKAAADKEAKKQYKSVNKLVNDKKTTLARMEITFPPVSTRSLQDLHAAFKDKVDDFGMDVLTAGRQKIPGYDVFSWRRLVTAEYDEEAREFRPVEPKMKMENTYLVHMSAEELARCIRDEDGVKGVVRRVREKYGPGRIQVFLMIDGLTAYYRRAGGIRYPKAQIESKLAALQMAEHVHLLFVDKPEDAAARLYDLSADLGIKPYKLIERSHLPFCANTHQTTGSTLSDTWVKMIDQIHRVTMSGADGIAEEFPTAARLFGAYEREPDPRRRDAVVMNCMVRNRVDGVANPHPIGQALSRVVGTVMYGTDPLALAYKGRD